MKATTTLLPLLWALAVSALAAAASAAVPPRSEGGQTLQVSDADLDLGQATPWVFRPRDRSGTSTRLTVQLVLRDQDDLLNG